MSDLIHNIEEKIEDVIHHRERTRLDHDKPKAPEPQAPEPQAAPSPPVYKAVVESVSTYSSFGEAHAVCNGSYEHAGEVKYTAKVVSPDGSVTEVRSWVVAGS